MPHSPTSIAGSRDLQPSLDRLKESLNELDQLLAGAFERRFLRPLKPPTELEGVQRNLHTQASEVEEAGSWVVAQLEQLNELVRTTALITSTLEIDLVLEDVMDTVIQLTGAERAYLMLYNNEKELEVRAARNWDQETLSEADVGLSQSVVNAAIEEGRPIITTNAQADQRFSGQASIIGQQLRSIVCIPLTLSGRPVGVLYADNRYKEGVFTEAIIPLLTAFGTQAAIAITNAHAFGQVRDDLEKAQRVIQELSIQIDQSRVDERVAEITSSGYFKELAEAAKEMRQRRKADSQ